MLCVTLNNRSISESWLPAQTMAEWIESFLLLVRGSIHTHFCQAEQSCRQPASTKIAINSALQWSGGINKPVCVHMTSCNSVWINYRSFVSSRISSPSFICATHKLLLFFLGAKAEQRENDKNLINTSVWVDAVSLESFWHSQRQYTYRQIWNVLYCVLSALLESQRN